MSDQSARLVIEFGTQTNDVFYLTQETTTLGRSAQNDIVLSDPEVSRHHAQIVRKDGQTTISDWGSTNGTFVNGQRVIGQARLQDGDEVELGDAVRLAFYETAAGGEEGATLSAETPLPPSAQATEVHEPWQPSDAMTPAPDDWSPIEPLSDAIPPVPLEASKQGERSGLGRDSRWPLACGCLFLVLILLCVTLLFVLDSYQQGRYLYCGALRPFWEAVLGPFGFAPICS